MPKTSRIRHSVHHPSIRLDKGTNNAIDDIPMKTDVTLVEDVPVKTASTEPVDRSKKAKQMERREAFIRKLGPIARHVSKSHKRRRNRKAREQLAGDMNGLQTALASLVKDIEPPQSSSVKKPSSSNPMHSGEVNPNSSSNMGKIGKGTSSTLSKVQRRQLLKLERLRQPFILANPDFASNPFQTIRMHAQNTLITRELPS